MGRQQLTAAYAALVLMAALAPMASAAETIPVDFYEITCQADPGVQWMSRNGRKMHVRGAVSQSILYDAVTFEELGQDTIVVNYTMKLRSGRMRICGTFSLLYQPLSRTATFDGTWRGNMNAAGFTARAVGDGTFGLESSKMKIDLQPLPPDQIPSEIQAILGQSPWTECAVVTGVGHWTGFVRVRSQD